MVKAFRKLEAFSVLFLVANPARREGRKFESCHPDSIRTRVSEFSGTLFLYPGLHMVYTNEPIPEISRFSWRLTPFAEIGQPMLPKCV
jgi:hypothetical protein